MSRSMMAVLQVGLLLVAVFANAASKSAIRIKVLDSQTSSVVLDDSGVPKNCDQLNYDAYCHSAKTEQVTNSLLVQEGNGTPYRVACTIESKWSRCTPLQKGESFDARKDKHGITIYYADEDGKPRKQLYTFVAAGTKSNAATSAAAVAAQPAGAQAQSSAKAPAEVQAQITAQAPPQNSVQALPAPVASGSLRETVKCSFSSTPAGAEVTLDGRYVGSTPSVLGLTVGTHVVLISMPGFTQWKRELAVASGSELTVNAVLEKAP